jgi:uncharacterized protein
MKNFPLLLLFLALSAAGNAQTINPNYDSLLAKRTGADPFGMKNYVFVILKTGSNKSADKNFRDSCFAGHLQNIKRLAALKQLIVAGPFGKNDQDFRGLFILNVATTTEALQLLATDPAIKENFLAPELYPWYGSAALGEYLEAADKVWKTGF